MSKRVVTGVNDLATTHPELAKQWHPDKNLPLLVSETLATTSNKLWWICDVGHEWQAIGESRAKGTGCPVCSGKKVLSGFNDLATTRPDLLSDWDRLKNLPLKPAMVMAGTHKFIWWKCKKGHSWSARGSKRALGQGCPVCAGRTVVLGENDLATINPELSLQWHPTKNGKLSPGSLSEGSGALVWWLCSKGHEWQTRINLRNRGTGCPVCIGQKIQAGSNDLATTNPELLKEWHQTKNKGLNPDQIGAGTNKKLWWICSLGHEWQSVGANRLKGAGCPVCSGLKILTGYNDLATLQPQLAKEWHPKKNAPLTPANVSAGSGKPVWWLCSLGHEWKAGTYQRSGGAGCPVCSGRTVWKDFNDLAFTHPQLLAQWHPTKNEDVSPDEVIAGTNKKLWWICELGHEWKTSGNKRVGGQGCPECASSGFDPGKPAIFYFIENLELKSRKVGITNVGTDRLSYFTRRGWNIIQIVERDEGHVARELEARVLLWIRVKHQLGVFLSRKDMGKRGGWTETFSTAGPSNKEVIRKIKSELGNLSREVG